MQNNYDNTLSLPLYHYLCENIGTEEEVRIRRLWYSANDMLLEKKQETVINSGSKGEGLNMKGSDLDIMYLHKHHMVLERIPDGKIGHGSFVMKSDDTKIGFTMLQMYDEWRHECPNCEFREVCCTKYGQHYYLSNQKVKYSLREWSKGNIELCNIHGPCVSDKDETLDFAFCVRCPTWIRQAEQWPTRNRTWPTSYLVSKIVRYGVLFVPLGCKDSPREDLEWRISFSVAEKQLVYSFNHTQLLCYALLKILLKDVIKHNNLLCSYFFKTIIFWVSEEISVTEWRPPNIIYCFKQCFKRIVYSVQYSVLSHYFIIDNNLFDDRFNSQDGMDLKSSLGELFQRGIFCFVHSGLFSDFFRNSFFCAEIKPLKKWRYINIINEVKRLVYAHICVGTKTNVLKRWLILVSRYKPIKSQMDRFVLKETINLHYLNSHHFYKTKTCSKNKDFFHFRIKYLPYLLLGVQMSAPVGWLRLATHYYCMGQLDSCLRITHHALHQYTPDKLINDHSTFYQHIYVNPKTHYRRHVDSVCIPFDRDSIPDELKSLHGTFLPVVYAHYLSFLCYFRSHQHRNWEEHLHRMKEALRNKYFICCQYHLEISYGLLVRACYMTHYVEGFVNSLLNSDRDEFNVKQILERTLSINDLQCLCDSCFNAVCELFNDN